MKYRKNKILIIFAPLFLITFFAAYSQKPEISSKKLSFQWPVSKDKITKISSTFGESRLDHFHAGVDISGEDLPIYPVEKGRLLWKRNPVRKKGEIPFGGGITVVIDHDSFWSGYMHLKKLSEPIEKNKNNETIEKKDSIGISGDTGHSGGAHLHFFVFDNKKRKIYNPLGLMPEGVYANKTPPTIEKYAILLPERLAEVELDKEIVMSGNFPVYAKIKDSSEKHERWGIYYLKAYSRPGDKPDIDILFDHIELKDARWRASNGKVFEEVYYLNWYLLGNNYKKTRYIFLETGGYNAPKKTEEIQMKIRDQ